MLHLQAGKKAIVIVQILFYLFFWNATSSQASNMINTAEQVSQSLLAVGTVKPNLRHQKKLEASRFLGTGFAIADGKQVVTSLHVVKQDFAKGERLAVILGKGRQLQVRSAEIILEDSLHDLAVLKITGEAIPTLSLAGSDLEPVGTGVGLSGFPLGINVGFYPVTHRGMIASVAPLASPMSSGEKMSAMYMRALRDGFLVYQLDATVLPGHSGSPVYSPDSGRVLGVVMGHLTLDMPNGKNLRRPSGISYIIPIRYLHDLLASINQ